MKHVGMMVLALLLVAGAQARADMEWSAAGDFDTGYVAGTTPNGAWPYGWSSSLSSPLTVYSRHRQLLPTSAGPPFLAWDDPNENIGFTPLVYLNAGSSYSDGNIDIPSG